MTMSIVSALPFSPPSIFACPIRRQPRRVELMHFEYKASVLLCLPTLCGYMWAHFPLR